MSDNWVVQNLQNALETWNSKFAEIWSLLTQSPESFKGGAIWNVILNIHGALQAIGYAMLVLFFVIGVVKTCGSFAELKKPEHALKLFIRFAIAKGVITYGLELLLKLMAIMQGVISQIMSASGIASSSSTVLPQSIIDAIEDCGILGIDSVMGGHADRRSVYYGVVVHYDYVCLRSILQNLYVFRDCACSALHLCR